VRDCGGKDYLEFAVRDACNRHRFPGPTIRAAGRMICMTGGHGNRHGRVADGVTDVVRAVREQIHAGSDFVKIMATGGVMTRGVNPQDAHYSPEEIGAGIAEARRFHRTTASHAQGTQGILNATRGGITSIEHGIYLDEVCITEMIERGTYLVPTLAAVANITRHPDAGIPAWALEKAQGVAEVHKQSIRAFAKAGGNIAMGTDAGTPFNLHGKNAEELQLMVDVGMSPSHALLAATRNAADLMQLPDEGRIEVGARADFLIVSGDPLADISRAADRTHHRAVIKHGKPVEPG
jgi:imidazolonepropionase-like amidohydrolase